MDRLQLYHTALSGYRQEIVFLFVQIAFMISSVFRTLRMIRNFGDGDQFSQKRLRAPQDVGLGRRKKFNSNSNVVISIDNIERGKIINELEHAA